MAKKKKKDDIKNTLLNVASTAKNIAIKSNSDSSSNASVPRPTTTLNNATKKVLSTPKTTQKSTVKAPTSKETAKSSPLPKVSSNTKIQQMAENSTKWNQIEMQKKLPSANVPALVQKQQELHNQNVKLAGNSFKFNPSGTWQNPISGQKAYDVGTANKNTVFLPYLPSTTKTIETKKTQQNTTASAPTLTLPFDNNAKTVTIGGKEYKIADTARVPSIIASNNKSEIENTLDRARAIAFSTLDTGSKEEAQKLLDTITSNYNDYKGKADDLEQIMYGLNARTQSKLSNALNYAVTQTVGSLAALGQTLTKPSADFISDIGGIKEFLTTSGADLQTKYQKGDYENNAVSADTFAAKELAKAEMARNNVLRETEGVTKNIAELGLMAVDTAPTLALSLIPQVGPALSATMVGAKSAGQKAFELQQQGVGATQALQRGLVSGGIDMLTSKFSIDNFLKSFSQKGAKNVIKNILTQAGAEAGDETSSYVLNYLADKAAKDPNATFSVNELSKIAIMSAMLGGLMGGTVSGINAITGRGLNNVTGVNTDTANTNANVQHMDNILFPPLEKTIAEYYSGDAIGDTQNIDIIRQLSTEQFINNDIPAGVPTLRTVAENHINNRFANAQNTQNTSLLSNQPLQNNSSVNVENMTSEKPLQVPTLRTVAENHIAETIAKNTQNTTNSQSQTVGQIIDNAIADAQNIPKTTAEQTINSDTVSDTQENADVVNILSAWDTVREFDKQIANFEDRVSFTQRDLKKIEAALLADDKSIVSTADNPQDALYMVELKSFRNAAYKPIHDYNQVNSSERNIQAMEWADYIADYATDKSGLSYFFETPERNIYDIFGKNKHLADEFIDTFLTPVHKDVAKRNKIANDYRSRVKKLKLDKHESAIVQYMIENELVGAKQYIADHKIKMTAKRTAKIDNAVTEFRVIYKELLDKINTALIRNGYEPVQSLGDFYAPHFIEKLSDRKLARLAYWLKIKITKKDQLPTDLAGVTEMNRPGKKWSGNLEHRKGTKTIYDAVRGFDQYIETVSDVIALTDSIQRLRSLEDAVRYRLSDEGTQIEIDAIKNDMQLNALQKRESIEKVYSQEQTNVEKIKQLLSQKDAGMRNFVTELRRYTDSLAGKKSRGDRGIEDIIGREVYEISKQVQNRITLDLLGANIAAASTNFIPLTQATGEIEMPYLIKGMYDTLKNVAKDDGFIDASSFLTNRMGSKPINQSFGQKFINKSMWVMEAIDYLVSNTIVRAKTKQNIQNGMDLDSAIDEADSFAASLMADRSKGAMPAVFEIQNPLIKPFTMFQLEVNNQLRYLGKDIPRRLGEQGGQAIAAALTNIFFMSFIGNEVFEKLMGRRPAFDPAGIIKNAMNVYYDVSKNTSDKIEQITTPFIQQLPFVGGMLDGGRVPISAAFPKLPNLWEGFNSELAPEKRKDLIITELSKPFFSFILPVGGNAIKRGIEGYNFIQDKGAYRINDEGESELMFAAPGNAPNDYLKAMLFGKYSNENGQNYINNGYQVLSPEYTQKYKKLISDEYGIDNNTAYDALMSVANAPSDEKRTVLMNTHLPANAKSYLDRTLFSYADSGNAIDYSDKAHFDITTNIDNDFLQNALYLHDNLGLNANEVINLIKTSSFKTRTQMGNKSEQIFDILNDIDELNVSDDLKNYAYSEILAPQISEKFTTEQGKQLLEGVPMREAIRSYYMRDIINEEIDNDNTIHQLDKKDYKTVGWQEYLSENALEEGMTFEQRENLRYFLSGSQSEFEKTWDDYVYGGNEKERENIEALRNCGLDTLTYQVIKSGISGFKADKDANGKPIDDSKKNKVSAYFKQWNLTDEQYALMMKLQGYKVGSSSSSKKSSSKKSSSKKSSGSSNSSSSSNKVKGGFKDFNGF